MAESEIAFSIAFPLSPQSYAIEIDRHLSDTLLPVGTVALVDPDALVMLGDTVINTETWFPVFVKLERDKKGDLIGTTANDTVPLPKAKSVKEFPKVVALLPAAYLFLEDKPTA